MNINAFITHKKAEHFADCQDRFSVNPDTKSVAVSDGMGSTWQQKIWAHLLSKAFTDDINWEPSDEAIEQLSFKWRKKVEEFIDNLKKENANPNIIYRNERNLAEGKSAGATFVGLRLNEKSWDGYVLGDSSLITWDGENATFYTSQSGEEFDSYPDYFDSDYRKKGKGTPKQIHIELNNNLSLFLVSDPFSEFLLEKKKAGCINQYILRLIDISNHDEYESIVAQWREEGMHNDDSTAIIIKPSDDISFSKTSIDDIDSLINDDLKEEMETGKIQKERVNNVDSKCQQSNQNIGTFNVNEQNNKSQECQSYEEKSEEEARNVLKEMILSECKSLLDEKFKTTSFLERLYSKFSGLFSNHNKYDIAKKSYDAFEESLSNGLKKFCKNYKIQKR